MLTKSRRTPPASCLKIRSERSFAAFHAVSSAKWGVEPSVLAGNMAELLAEGLRRRAVRTTDEEGKIVET